MMFMYWKNECMKIYMSVDSIKNISVTTRYFVTNPTRGIQISGQNVIHQQYKQFQEIIFPWKNLIGLKIALCRWQTCLLYASCIRVFYLFINIKIMFSCLLILVRSSLCMCIPSTIQVILVAMSRTSTLAATKTIRHHKLFCLWSQVTQGLHC